MWHVLWTDRSRRQSSVLRKQEWQYAQSADMIALGLAKCMARRYTSKANGWQQRGRKTAGVQTPAHIDSAYKPQVCGALSSHWGSVCVLSRRARTQHRNYSTSPNDRYNQTGNTTTAHILLSKKQQQQLQTLDLHGVDSDAQLSIQHTSTC
jgi:hypothetical protein